MMETQDCIIRSAISADENQVVEGVRLLLAELKGVPETTLPSTAGKVFHKI